MSFKIIMTSVARQCFTTQHQTKTKTKTTACKTKTNLTKTVFWSQTGLVLRPTVSDHITEKMRATSNLHLGSCKKLQQSLTAVPQVLCAFGARDIFPNINDLGISISN